MTIIAGLRIAGGLRLTVGIGGNDMAKTRLLRRTEVEARVGLKRSSIYLLMSKGLFPQSLKIGQGSVGWVEKEIDSWIAAAIRERDNLAKSPAVVDVYRDVHEIANELHRIADSSEDHGLNYWLRESAITMLGLYDHCRKIERQLNSR